MSAIKELYEKYLNDLSEAESLKVKPTTITVSDLTEKQRCKILGIPCSYGICDECDFDERNK